MDSGRPAESNDMRYDLLRPTSWFEDLWPDLDSRSRSGGPYGGLTWIRRAWARRTRRCQNRGSAAIFCEVICQKPNPLLGSRYEMGPPRARFTLFHDMYKLVGHNRLNKKLFWKQFSTEVHTISISYPAHIVINFDLPSKVFMRYSSGN